MSWRIYASTKKTNKNRKNVRQDQNEYKYDAFGNEIEHRVNYPDSSGYNLYKSFYDSQNRCVRTETYESDVLESFTVFYFDDMAKHKYPNMMIHRKANGKLIYKHVTEKRTDDGRILRESMYKGNGHIAWSAKRAYDDAVNLKEKIHFKGNKIFYKILRNYDSDGNLVKEEQYLSQELYKKWNGSSQMIDFNLWLLRGYGRHSSNMTVVCHLYCQSVFMAYSGKFVIHSSSL